MRRRGNTAAGLAEAKQAIAIGQNARQMVLTRDPRFVDLAAIVTQLVSDLRTTNTQVTDVASHLADTAAALATNTNADAATRTKLKTVTADLGALQTQMGEVDAEYDRLEATLNTATAQLAAADEAMTARILAAEKALANEATVRAAADSAEAATRAAADAQEARARADADTANAQLAAAATAAEQAARVAADQAETSARTAADTALTVRMAALENYMPSVTSGRASKTSMLMLAGTSTDIPVTFDAPAPDLNYTPIAILDVPNLADYTVAGFKAKTTTGVTVTVKNRSLVSLTATVNVTVMALKL